MIEHLLGHSITRALLAWVSGGRRPEAERAKSGLGWSLSYGPRYKLLFTFLALAASGMLVVGLAAEILEGPLEWRMRIAGFGVFGGLALYGWLTVLRAYWYRVDVFEWGLAIHLPGRQVFRVPWSEVIAVSATKRFDAVLLHRVGKPPVRLLTELDGWVHLLRELERVRGYVDPTIVQRLSTNDAKPW